MRSLARRTYCFGCVVIATLAVLLASQFAQV
jgi:hypothetical protein